MEINTSNKNTERAHRVGEKSNDKEGAIVAQFSFYEYKINILRNLISLRELKLPYSKVFPKRQYKFVKKWKEVLAITKQGKISYLQYRSAICEEGQTPA